MHDFRNRTAVITGAASGIGRALAERAAREGMNVALADVEAAPLAEAAAALRTAGATVLPIVTDVSRAADVAALADQARAAFGAIHLLCNNARVVAHTSLAAATLADWQWILGVNLWGVIHGIHAFLPAMLDQDAEAHIVNTASMAGFLSAPYMGIYNVSKHGVVTLTETLHRELLQRGAKVKVSLLCPGFVQTGIMESSRNRPAHLAAGDQVPPDRRGDKMRAILDASVRSGTPPSEVADAVFDALRQDRFYILTHPELKPSVSARLKGILEERNPSA